MRLSDLRKKIDDIDNKLMHLIAERIGIVKKIGELKKKRNISVMQKTRESQMKKTRLNLSKKLNIPCGMAEDVFSRIIKESHRLEKNITLNISIQKKSGGLIPRIFKLKRKKLKLKKSMFEIFKSVYANCDNFYFLESLEKRSELSRYSYIGFDPLYTASSKGNDYFLNDKKIGSKKIIDDIFSLTASTRIKGNGFIGGLIGYLSYESLRYTENLPIFKKNREWPDQEFSLYLDGLFYDKKTKEIIYYTVDKDRSEKIEEMLASPFDLKPLQVKVKEKIISDKKFLAGVKKIKKHISAGDIFQAVLSQRSYFEIKGSTLHIYDRLRKINPSPHMFFLKFGERELIGSSPELVARVEKGIVETFPIAGTRGRGKTVFLDKAKAKEMLKDEKERAEHMMLVDMARNDLGRVCEFSSIKVENLMDIKKYSHVQHLVSRIRGKLKKNKTSFDAITANMPMGTVSGAPRLEAVKILEKLEPEPRGPYGGGVGFFSFSGDAAFCLAIRSLFINGSKAFNQAGAGIVHDSIPEYELEEVRKKSMCIRKALGIIR